MSFLEFFDKGYRELHPEAQAFWSMGKFGLAGATLAGGLAMGGPIGAAAAALKVPSIVSTFNAGRTALADVARSNDISAADISQSISHSARRGVDPPDA